MTFSFIRYVFIAGLLLGCRSETQDTSTQLSSVNEPETIGTVDLSDKEEQATPEMTAEESEKEAKANTSVETEKPQQRVGNAQSELQPTLAT
ncbi:MAG: hypothetical protein HKM28_01020, partial [Flavobacteriaceae bacterium]|nr:hypothetical protein [Flavobacteriaceae bacterium]